MTGYLEICLRSLISILVLFVLTRSIGKRQISQLSFFDYIIGITIGSISAVIAIDRSIPYTYGILSMLIYSMSAILASYISLKSLRARKILEGVPTILVQNGKFIENNLKSVRYHINDVLEELRMKGAFNIADVEFAILETSGQISVQMKSQKQPLTPSDINLPTSYQGLCANIIIDGNIMHDNLRLVNLDQVWLIDELAKRNIANPDDILLAALDTSGNLYIDLKKKTIEPLRIIE